LRIQFLEELRSEGASQPEASFLRKFLGEPGGEVLGEEVEQGVLPSLHQFHLRPEIFIRPAQCPIMSLIQDL
jgi:hypothetical protein